MEDAWRMHGGCMEDAWRMHEGCMKDAWRMYEGCMKDAWRMHGGCMEEWKSLLNLLKGSNRSFVSASSQITAI